MEAMRKSLPYCHSNGDSDQQTETFADHPFVPVTIVFLILAYVSVALRIWTRKHFVKIMGWDDVAMIATLVNPRLALTVHSQLTIQLLFSVFCASLIALFALVGTARAIHAVNFERIKTVVNVSTC
jgi:hypothetical protein